MKKVLSLFLFVLLAAGVSAQSPSFNVKNADSLKVKMNQMKIDVKIVGNIAYTNVEMHFFNGTNRQMEGELIFPLPEGISVSHYAIDINGKMREAVPVNKSKGKQVFEAIQNRRVDPGLLERVGGNNFRTRVYPIMPNNKRIVQIGYEQELTFKDGNHLLYQFLSRFPQKLDNFTVNIEVLGDRQPQITGTEDVQFMQWTQSFKTTISKNDYLPDENFEILIPVRENMPAVFTQNADGNNYFYAQLFLDAPAPDKKEPKTIGLIYDVSLSMRSRNFEKESDLLRNYLASINDVTVSVYFLNYNFSKKQDFIIKNGNTDALIDFLKTAVYDGGTRFSEIKLPANVDEYLFFTDGLSTLSEKDFRLPDKPVYTVSSSVSADYSFLNFLSMNSSANFINLNTTSINDALQLLNAQSLRFLGVKNNLFVTELFPAVGTPVGKSFSVAGISLRAKNDVTLLFGYGNTPTIEKTISLDESAQNNTGVNVFKLWAQKKIAYLDIDYSKNQTEIEILGTKAGIATRNTSLIVLETIDDYIRYEVVPPAELRDEFDRISKERQLRTAAQQQSNMNNLDSYFTALNDWWKRDLKYDKPAQTTSAFTDKSLQIERAMVTMDEVAYVAPVIADMAVPAEEQAQIVEESVDLQTAVVPEKSVISAYSGAPTTERRWAVGSDAVRSVYAANSYMKDDMFALGGGVSVSQSTENQENQPTQTTISKTTNPYTAVEIIRSQPKEKQYEAYLQIREDVGSNPTFYIETARAFREAGDNEKALLVLSSIADLGFENHQLYKTLTYLLREWGATAGALFTAQQVAKWRDFEPQSFRDLALTLEENGKYQEAFDMLVRALETNYLGEMSRFYTGIEDVILMDMNRLIMEKPTINTQKLDKKYLEKMPVDVRVVMNWNYMNTDIDLHVTDPTGEECYYSHRTTRAGGRYGKDFTQGYGPEQFLLRNKLSGKYTISSNFFGEDAFTENGPASVFIEVYYKDKNGKMQRELKTILSDKNRREKATMLELDL